MRCTWVVIGILGGLALAAAPQRDGQADVLFERAVQKETADGDLKGAVEMYRKLAAGANRAVAAKALIRMGQCYEKLGDADARKAYERVVREFADQKDAVAEARRRLGDKPGVVARLIERPAGVEERVHEVSRDGRFLVCSSPQGGRRAIYLRDVETGATRPILGESPRMRHPLRLSPDGSQIAFISRDLTPGAPPAELHVVRTDGSALRAFTAKDLGGMPRVPSLSGWTPDGQNLLLTISTEDNKGKVVLVRVSDGAVRDLGPAAGMSWSIYQVRLSPDGRWMAFTRPGGPGYMGKGISIRTLDGSREVSLSPDGLFPIWTPDGKRVLFTSNRRGPTDLWAIPVANGEPAGPPQMVRESLEEPIGFTRDGELFYLTRSESRDLYTVEFDPHTGRPVSKATKITDRYVNAGAAWSPDSKLLAYASLRDGKEPGAGDPASLVIRTLATGDERVVAPKILLDMNLSNPHWFPDSRSLLIQPQWGQQFGKLAKVDVETGDVQFLPTPASLRPSGNWYGEGATLSPDGKTLYYSSRDPRAQQVRILRRELPSGEEKELKSLKAGVTHLSVSPDGSRLAFWMRPHENDQNVRILTTMPAEGGELSQVKTGNVFPWYMNAWSADGKRIFFTGLAQPGATPKTSSDCDIWSVPVEGGEPVPLGIDLHTTIWFFHLHPDGKRLVFYDESSTSAIWSLKNLPGVGKASR